MRLAILVGSLVIALAIGVAFTDFGIKTLVVVAFYCVVLDITKEN